MEISNMQFASWTKRHERLTLHFSNQNHLMKFWLHSKHSNPNIVISCQTEEYPNGGATMVVSSCPVASMISAKNLQSKDHGVFHMNLEEMHVRNVSGELWRSRCARCLLKANCLCNSGHLQCGMQLICTMFCLQGGCPMEFLRSKHELESNPTFQASEFLDAKHLFIYNAETDHPNLRQLLLNVCTWVVTQNGLAGTMYTFHRSIESLHQCKFDSEKNNSFKTCVWAEMQLGTGATRFITERPKASKIKVGLQSQVFARWHRGAPQSTFCGLRIFADAGI